MGKGREYAKGLGEAYSQEKNRMMTLEQKLGMQSDAARVPPLQP